MAELLAVFRCMTNGTAPIELRARIRTKLFCSSRSSRHSNRTVAWHFSRCLLSSKSGNLPDVYLNSDTAAYRNALPPIQELTCESCGVTYLPPTPREVLRPDSRLENAAVEKADAILDRIVKFEPELTDKFVQNLTRSATSETAIIHDHSNVNEFTHLCQRCHSIYYQNRYEEAPPIPYQELFRSIRGQNYVVVVVIDAYDFPLSFIPAERLLARFGAMPRKVIYVVSRSDLLVRERREIKERLKPYVLKLLNRVRAYQSTPRSSRFRKDLAAVLSDVHQQEQFSLWTYGLGDFSAKVGYPVTTEYIDRLSCEVTNNLREDQLYFVSSKRGWGIHNLSMRLGPLNFFLGYSNVGKSSLIRAIVRETGGALDSVSNKKTKGPGESFWPGLTRAAMNYTVHINNKKKQLIDLPGLEDANNSIWDQVKNKMVKSIVTGRVLDRKRREHMTLKQGKCLNIGGLCFIESPDVNMIVWPMISQREHGVIHVNRNLETAIKIASNEDSSKRMLVHVKDAENIKQVAEVKIDGGGADVVFRGIGFVELRISGKVPKNGALVKVFALKHADIAVRAPIFEALKDRKTPRQSMLQKDISAQNKI
ncbi:uncharacterized protein V1516DRAFT_674721 [Lipomyces oligophaga]|uniref:uncharacterized protein n=1 Tax=Lipomyces oligophaga TaxID=45792 RepID=UPI0034CFC16C